MTLDQLTVEFAQGISESNEAMRNLTREEIFQQALTNSRSRHQDSSMVTFSTSRGTGLTSTTTTAFSTTPARPGK